jgi:Family of unknown function (DUF5343)
MAEKHPYSPSGGGAIVQTINQLRNAFPTIVTAGTLTKLSIAPNNESYVINILRFLDLIDEKGAKTSKAGIVFSKHEDAEFQKAFAELVQANYKDLFELHGKNAWELPIEKLISFFRGTDQTSAIVGKRQAQTFRALASMSGHGEAVKAASTKPVGAKKVEKPSKKAGTTAKNLQHANANGGNTDDANRAGVGLTVRIEINLPASGDQETYDRIFKSIRENLLRG